MAVLVKRVTAHLHGFVTPVTGRQEQASCRTADEALLSTGEKKHKSSWFSERFLSMSYQILIMFHSVNVILRTFYLNIYITLCVSWVGS